MAQWNKFYWRAVIFNPSIYLIGPLIIIFNKTPILASYEITKKDPFIYPGPIGNLALFAKVCESFYFAAIIK